MKKHRNPSDQRASIDWARSVLGRKSQYVILDTETTGLKEIDEVIQIGIIDLKGNTVLETLVKPSKKKSINKGASDVHGILMKDLKSAPTFNELTNQLTQALKGKEVIAYNSEFDARLYAQSCMFSGGGYIPKNMKLDWDCAMKHYARFLGDWNDYHQDYKWPKLQGGDHSAVGDCLATLKVIKKMANATKQKRWYEFWVTSTINHKY